MCLKEQQKRQLRALLWRAQVVLKRKSKQLRQPCLYPMIVLAMLIMVKVAVKLKPYDIVATEHYSLTTSGNPAGEIYFGTAAMSQRFNLQFCYANGAETYAIVNNTQVDESCLTDLLEPTAGTMANAYLESVGKTLSPLYYQSWQELNHYVTRSDYQDSPICFALGIETCDKTSNDYNIAISMYPGTIPSTTGNQVEYELLPYAVLPGNIPLFQKYQYSGFYQLMTTATDQLLKNFYETDYEFKIAYLPMNTGKNSINDQIIFFVALYPLVLMNLTIIGRIVTFQIVPELNESKIRWLLQLNGVHAGVRILYEITVYLCTGGILAVLMSLVSKAFFTNVGILILFLLGVLYVLQWGIFSVITQCLMPQEYALVFQMCWQLFNFFLGIIVAFSSEINPTAWYTLSVLPYMQVENLLKIALLLSERGMSLHLGNCFNEYLGVKPGMVLVIGFCEVLFLLLVLAYIWPLFIEVDQEKNLRFWYPFTATYWCGKLADQVQERLLDDREGLQDDELKMIEDGLMERLRGTESRKQLQINRLRKVYGDKAVVDDLSLTLFNDQVLVLLGHNGAGKTTTINMLTSQIKANGGSAILDGIDLLSSYSALVDTIGVCPQENVLLLSMTARENLQFFCRLKGIDEACIEPLFQQFSMQHQLDTLSSLLSGGQKRKLQLMISMIGECKIMLLDEPTSGMDPQSRRETWDVIRNAKKDKIVILTTHYMDEAEVLADRVAMMNHGQLQCCGSSLWLKDKYSKGFYLEVTPDGPLQDLEHLLNNHLQKVSAITSGTMNENGQMSYVLPKQSTSLFREIFTEIDKNLGNLNIVDYQVRVASLEEVFIAMGKDESGPKVARGDSVRPSLNESQIEVSFEPLSKEDRNIWRTFFAMVKMNILVSKATYIFAFFVAPVICIMMGFVLSTQIRKPTPQIVLSDYQNTYEAVLPLTVPYGTTTVDGTSVAPFLDPLAKSNFKLDPVTSHTDPSADPLIFLESFAATLPETTDTYFGAYSVYSLTSTSVEVAVFGNLASLQSPTTFGSLMCQNIAQTQNSDISLTFTNKPTEWNAQIQTTKQPIIIVPYFLFMPCVCVFVWYNLTWRLAGHFHTGFYQQVMHKSGSPGTYIAAQYCCDLVIHLWIALCILVCPGFFGFSLQAFWVPCLLFAIAEPFFTYAFAYWRFRDKALSPQVIYKNAFFQFFITGFIGSIFCAAYGLSGWHTWLLIYALIFSWIPVSTLCWSAAAISQRVTWAGEQGILFQEIDPLGKYGARIWVYIQALNIVFYAIWLWLLVYDKFTKHKAVTDRGQAYVEEPLAMQEQERVSVSDDLLRVVGLEKIYPVDPAEKKKNPESQGTHAVKGISFGVTKGEVFALLGVNGAGKSSTFEVLSAQSDISKGDVTLDHDLITDYYKKPYLLTDKVGYCPQTNAQDANLTVGQTLTLLCEMHGTPKHKLVDTVRDLMIGFNIAQFEGTRAGDLSGGNKRKLMCAMGCLGNPQVILIDEASAGVDPASRRTMWQGIRKESRDSAVVITTHAMEEAEALANKLAIMASGKMQCFGTLQQVKDNFGKGFDLQFNIDSEKLEAGLTVSEGWASTQLEISTHLRTWQDTMPNLALSLEKEFSAHGLLKHHYNEVSVGKISLYQLQKDCLIQNFIMTFMDKLRVATNGPVTLVQYDGTFVHLQIEQASSCGCLFATIEELKANEPIREYSCSQSSLEMIFNAFAKRDQFKALNRQ